MRVNIVYLGVSAAAPSHGRGLPSILIVVDGVGYLFDVGEGTQERLQAAGFGPLSIRAVFVTHLHGDHFFGLPGLLQYMTLSSRREHLHIVGPHGLIDYIECSERTSGHVRSYDIVFRRVGAGMVYQDDRVVVEAFPVCHSGSAYGYKIYTRPEVHVDIIRLKKLGLKPGPYISRLKRGESVYIEGRRIKPEDILIVKPPRVSIVYTGDTRPCATVVEAARNASLLIHDSTFSKIHLEEAREKRHSTAYEAGIVARVAGVKCLALFHISARYKDTAVLASEARLSSGLSCVYVAEPYMQHILEL